MAWDGTGTAAAAGIVTLAEAKLWAKVTAADDDALITSLIAAAEEYAEEFTRRRFVHSTETKVLPRFADPIELPRSPLSSVTSIIYINTAGTTASVATSVYSVDTAVEPGLIRLAYGQSWPTTRDVYNAVTITHVVGYSADATSVPDGIKTAVKMLVAHWYEHRESVVVGTITAEVPMGVKALLWQFRVPDTD